MLTIIRELKVAARALRRSPGFSLLVIAVLGIGLFPVLTLLLIVVGTAAALAPARQALRVNPIEALRHE